MSYCSFHHRVKNRKKSAGKPDEILFDSLALPDHRSAPGLGTTPLINGKIGQLFLTYLAMK